MARKEKEIKFEKNNTTYTFTDVRMSEEGFLFFNLEKYYLSMGLSVSRSITNFVCNVPDKLLSKNFYFAMKTLKNDVVDFDKILDETVMKEI